MNRKPPVRKLATLATLVEKPATPAVLAIGQLNISGNVTPHVWYLRTEFRTDAGRPNRNMITAVADILYWYRPQEVRDEEQGGIFVGYARKFQRDMLQYDYERRGEVFGMSKREMQEACTAAAKRGLIRIEYRTEKYRGTLLHNIVYIEPVVEAIAATLTGPNAEPVAKAKGATRGRHAKAISENDGVDDQTPPEDQKGGNLPNFEQLLSKYRATSQNFGELKIWGDLVTSQNFETLTSQNFGTPLSKFWDTYHETYLDISFSREFIHSSTNNSVSKGEVSSNAAGAATENVFDVQPHPRPESIPTTSPESAPDGAGAFAPPQTVVRPVSSQEPAQGEVETKPDTALEKVPGAAGRPRWAILGLEAVPSDELLNRPDRDVSPTLKALTKHTHKKPAELLEYLKSTATQTGAIDRMLLLKLLPPELDSVVAAAKEDAARGFPGGFDRAASFGVDRLIGAQITQAIIEGTAGSQKSAGGYAPPTANGAATTVQNPGAGAAWVVGQQVEYGGQRCEVVAVGSTKIAIDEIESGVGHTVFAKDFRKLRRVN
ncbi:hypothetical protein [Deinococcus ruber]|uniref:DnaA N-terminal domain-containing protein n=1 Tax=Deinococcus ruber TaxID=1848197 RepID=A0A918CD07_9DEIO|nr:hypothetical protein [Deinococcus ruber]GGR16536.1 hypothetical protein GCM10008957_31480 [Deinococcus ruber]